MDAGATIPCVIYAAKSTEDKRGSIPGQLRDCREAIEADPLRYVVAEYKDERFSAYRRDRGPGLRDARQHAEDLAAQHGVAELWAQHSDRIARGDGKAAQHTVEVALWALKAEVRVRTLQDPDTFRDLLYAVVTGQRNNEDSKRKALATQAGRKRAAARGEFLGYLPDGYRRKAYLDARGELCKAMELDPERQPLIELIFRLALRGRSCGQIAASVNDAGWLSKPARSGERAKPFTHSRVHMVVANPRYAALSTYHDEMLARGNWPAYISERQHLRILARLAQRDRGGPRRRRESYLLERIARCGRCGCALHARTGIRRRDGSNARRYVCSSHTHFRGRVQCAAAPIEAHTAEAMLIESLSALLLGEELFCGAGLTPGEGADSLRARLREALLAEDERATQQAIESLFERMQPHAAQLRRQAGSQRQARELADAERLRAWLAREKLGRTEATRAQSAELTKLLAGWFSQITIEVQEQRVTITATRREGAGAPPRAREVQIDRTAWTRGTIGERCALVRYATWTEPEIIAALQAWAQAHGRSPWQNDWRKASACHPQELTVTARLGSWERALRLAGLPPPPQRVDHHPWTRAEILARLRAWFSEHGRAPESMEWWLAAPGRPSSQTVRVHFGSWTGALKAAGIEQPPRRPGRREPWARAETIAAFRAWHEAHGCPPRGNDWMRAAPEHPACCTVRKNFGSWRAALEEAGL